MAKYQPGVCNIGPHGRWMRLILGLVLFALAGYVFQVFPKAWATQKVFALAIPLSAGFLSLFEATLATCVGLGSLGLYDLDEKGRGSVKNKLYRQLDFYRSQVFVLASVLWGLLSAIVLVMYSA